jgi:hypothetical protein
VNTYVVPRTRAFLSEEEIDAVIECGLALIETMNDELRFIRSYVVHEDDGTYSAFCVYEATGPEVLERYSEAMRLPTDAIKHVATTVVNAPDPA